MGYGVEDPSSGIHGDEEYLYVMELPEYDFSNPAETGDWHVKVSEHCGFPRWDDETNHAFERAEWQFEGLAAACLYIAARGGSTQLDIATRAGVTTPTLRDRVRELEALDGV